MFDYEDNFQKYRHIQSALCYEDDFIIENPFVSIMIPTFKRPVVLREAIESSLNQVEYKNYEIVVVDNDADCEFDIGSIVAQYKSSKLKYYKNKENIGMFGNWNRCVELARGEWIVILNDDDWLEVDFLKEWFSTHAYMECDVCSFSFYPQDPKEAIFKKNNNKLKQKINKIKEVIDNGRELNKYDFLFSSPIHGTLGIIAKKATIKDFGGFNDNYYPSADKFFWVKLIHNNCKIIRHAKKLANYRVECNDSLNLETIKLWIEKDRILAEQIIKHWGFPMLRKIILDIHDDARRFLYERNGYSMGSKGGRISFIMNYFFNVCILIFQALKRA
ncbi:MAG: glycosyltransferase family 2 protein [Proteobacteria bacterium]|nr:glycosyltransferase family 2 protein [Pseudomonadota bacterium]